MIDASVFGPPSRPRPISPELREQLAQPPRWMYPWRFSPDIEVPLVGDHLREVHLNRAEMMQDAVQAVVAEQGTETSGIDLACNEGWFSHRLVDWGVRKVTGLDIRAQLIRRAELVRDHFSIAPDRILFRCANVLSIDPAELEPADVVLALGVVYHVEEPVRLLRVAHALTRRLCVIESQVARTETPIKFAWGVDAPPGVPVKETPAALGAFFEGDQDVNLQASHGQVLSFVPNVAALELMAKAAGFANVEIVDAAENHGQQFRSRDRVVVLARP